jgi:hypothetical protein
MAFRRSHNKKSLGKSSRRAPVRRPAFRRDPRGMRLETLEERRLLAVGPELVAVQASSGSLLRQDSVEHVAPRDLVFRFDDGQVIDAGSLAAITVTRLVPGAAPTDPPIRQPIQPGFVGIGDMPNEVVLRFADTLTDDVYEVDIGGRGNVQLVNINNDPFDPRAGRVAVPFTFKLNLGAQIIAVVPQPINRGVSGELTQARNQIEVYFNDDDLHPTAISSAAPGVKPTVVDPQFYRLIFTNDTVTNQDGGPTGTGEGTVFNPSRIDYDPATDKAVLTFLDDNGDPLPLDQLPTGPGTYRLRIGTNEVLPAAPVAVHASISVRSDFNTNHQVEILLTPDMSVAEGNEISVEVSRAAISPGADPNDAASYVPGISVTGRRVSVTLRSADLNDPSARGTTAAQLVDALNAHPQASVLLTASIAGGGRDVNLGNREVNYSPLLLVDPGSQFTTATDLNDFGFSFAPGADGAAKTIIVSSAIDKQFFALNFPGAQDEPGHRDIPVQGHVSTPLFFSPMNTSSVQAGTDVADRFDGITTIPYNFRDEYGRNPGSGLPFINVISEEQKQRAREVFEIYGAYLGVQFVETDDQGLIIATGDLRAVNPFLPSQPGGTTGITGPNTLDGQLTVVLDNAENWSDEFGIDVQGGQISWFEEAMEGIGRALGLGNSDDLPPLTVQGEESALGQSSTGEPFLREDNLLPGDHDIVHGQHLYRPDSKDVDLFRFQITEFGRFTAETFAERLAVASHLDTVLSLYREEGDGTRMLISRNDDYYSNDSFVEMDLIPGVYYVGVTASGNTNFDPENGDTGIGGKTDGKYDLRLNFRPQADAAIVDIDTAGSLPDRQALDGDGDGTPGGVFNFWFRALPPMNPAAPQIDSVIYVDKAAPQAGANGTLARPFREIDQAFAFINSVRAANLAASPEFVVRILGNNGPTHNPQAPLNQRLPYVLGRDPILGQALADGVDLEVPQGVTVMIDEGAVFKMRRSSVIVGSLLPTIDRSKAAVQVLGVPGNNVIFTSYNDEAIGQDTNANASQTPSPGDWGGIIIRNDVDRAAPGQRFDYERQGIFLNHINQTDFRYGGGSVTLGSVEEVVAPISMVDARPTITFNTITRSADAAMSANPDSFEESNFHDPATQQQAYDPVAGVQPFTVDYRRVGPHIHGNRLVLREVDPQNSTQFIVHRNSLNGLFVRIGTASGQATETLTVAGRFDDKDIVHILQENLEVQGTPGGLTVERYIEGPAPIPLARTAGGTLAAGTYNYFVTFIDAAGVEGPRSAISNNSVITGGPGQGTIRLRIQPPTVGEFVQYRLYRSGPTGTGPYTLVTQQQVSTTIYDDTGATLGGVYTGAAREPQFQQTLPGGALSDGTYNYFVTFVDINGVEGPASPLSQNVTINPGTPNRTVRLGIEQPPLGEHLVWRLYRSQPNARGPYLRVVERPATEFTYDDDGDFNDPGEIAGLTFRGNFVRVERGRLDARLKVDPNVIVKTEGARIEVSLGAQIIAEGRDGQEVIFTSLVDQRYGAGGTFDTANRSTAPQPGDWGGIYVGHTGSASFDHAVLAFGGGVTRVPGGFANFNVLEIHQAQARVANSTFEFNTDGVRELDQVDDPDRVGRGVNAPGVIFIRGAQPVIINNLIRNYPATVAEFNPAITINVNALNSDLVTDWGRTTGELDRFNQMLDNQGPLFRNNILVNDETNNGALHGMMVRGNVLTTAGVWDDTDIVHILMNEVLVPDFHSKGGLRLESSPTESLVIKLRGADAGFTASGRPLDIDDRIGGSLRIIGQPGHPVILTSLADDSAAAGQTLNGGVQFDTDNDGDDIGTPTTPGPVPPPSGGPLVVTSTTNDGNALRDALLGPGVIPVGNATFTGSATSAGFFQNGGSSIQIETGILLTTGDANFAAGPNVSDGSSGQASGQGDPMLNQLFNVNTTDTTALEFDFMIAPGASNNLFFNYVFASEEYNEFANSSFNDVFAFFLDGQNIALIPGTQTFVSINNVNGGNPLGTNAQNPQFYNNNDPSDNGGFLAEFGYDGFTTVFQAQALNLAPGTHTIRLVVSDVADSILDTGVFLQAGSFSNAPVPPTVIPESGDWRSIKLLQHANDRNVSLVTEREANNAVAPGLNAVPENAQFLGELAPNERAGDDVRRLGFEVHGFLSARNDIDVYSFRAQTGTEVWFDIDNTTHGLDTVLELIDANGVVIARSDNSLDETNDPSLLFRNTSRIAANHVNPLAKSDFEIDDHFSTNPKDPGMRVVLPGSTGAVGTYHVRVRSAGSNTPGELLGGRSSGRYELQLRLREKDEVPGSTINFADIRFATTGIEVQGLPLHSPLLGEFAETSSSNQVRADAQNLGNVLQSDRGAITVAGFLDGNNPDDPVPGNGDPDDVDWYRFTVDYDSIGGSTGRGAGLIFDLDFADNLGRPNARIAIFDSQGRLILSSDNSNISDDVSAPLGGTGARDLERGSGGPLDPFLGPIQLPAGEYFIAVSHAGDRPAELDVTSHAPNNPLVRLEPIESVARIAEDHIDFQGGSTVQPQQPLTPLFGGGAGTFVPFNLSDVNLFVSTSFGEQTDLHIVDAFSGAQEAFVGRFGFGTADIAMRGDGSLFSYSVDRVGGDAQNDAQQGNFLQINTGTGQATNLRDDGIMTFEPDAQGNPQRTHPFPPPNGGRIGHGISFNAMSFNRTGTQLFVAGNRGNFYQPGAEYVSNILYRMEGSDVDGDGLAAGLPDTPQRPNPLGRAGTNFLDQGEIPTAIDLVGGGASVIVAPGATTVTSGGTQFVINDGDTFDIQVDDGFGNLTPPVTFEFNSGPEATINFNIANNEFFVDGEFFTLDGQRFEFDTGVVLVPNGFQPGQLTEGAQIEIRDNAATPNVRVFEITTDPVVQQGAIPLLVTPQMTEAQFVSQVFVPAVNQQFTSTTFNAQAFLSNGRVTLTGDSFVVLRGGNTGFNLSGNYGVSGNSIRIIAEETFQPGEIIQQILNTMNGVPGSPTNPLPGVPNIEAGADGTRINFLGAQMGDFDSNDTTNAASPGTARFMTGVPGSDGSVAMGNWEIPFFASDSGEDIALKIIAAVEDVSMDNTANDPMDRFDPDLEGVIPNGTNPPAARSSSRSTPRCTPTPTPRSS